MPRSLSGPLCSSGWRDMPERTDEPQFITRVVMPIVWWWQRHTGGYRSTRWRERMIVKRIDRG
jgi:hypothetical protein